MSKRLIDKEIKNEYLLKIEITEEKKIELFGGIWKLREENQMAKCDGGV